jgi:NADPH-dependent 2,4-dienoyl-CoA reductase/sulfur reductase-like enzyme
MLSLEHWGNAVAQAEVAAHNMVNPGPLRRPHLAVPAFWSSQFGLNIKSVGVPTFSDQVVIAPTSPTVSAASPCASLTAACSPPSSTIPAPTARSPVRN